MTIVRIVDLKERIATCDALSLEERKFLLRCIDPAITRKGIGGPQCTRRRTISAHGRHMGVAVDRRGRRGRLRAPMGGMSLPLIAANK